MRINVDTDKKIVEYIRAVKLDGQHISMCTTLDTIEGWVEVKVPRIQHPVSLSAGQQVDVTDNDMGQHPFDWESKRYHGKVEIVWYDDTPTEYRSIE